MELLEIKTDLPLVFARGKIEVGIRTFGVNGLRIVATCGSSDDATEFEEQLPWLLSALSVSPYDDLHVALTKARSTFQKSRSSSDYEFQQFTINIEHDRLQPTDTACWLPLFSGAVLSHSPLPNPDRGNETGLEIAIDLLAGLSGVQHAVVFHDGVVMKGLSQMFIPIRKTEDRIQWHAVSSSDPEIPLTYREGLSNCGPRALLEEVSLDDMRTCRHFVGWCSVALSRLGSDTMTYENIHYSRATDKESSTKCSKASLGFQQFGTAALDFEFGVTEGKCHFKRDGPYRNIVNWAEKTLVVLYDAAERRGWLVPASEAMLHIIQCRHRSDPFEVDGKRIMLDTNVAVGSSAKEVLLKNMSIQLSDDDHHTFKTEIANVWSLLDFLIAENVASEQKSSGITIQSPWTDIIYGFEFNAVVEQHSPFRQKQTKLLDTNGGWARLSQDIDALVLFANGFEDIIVPEIEQGKNDDLCRSWRYVPKEKDYLAVSTSSMKQLYERAGCPLDRKFLTSSGSRLQWHQGCSLLFGPCAEPTRTRCRCNRLQRILPKSTTTTIIPPEHIVDKGAVIFGRFKSNTIDERRILRVAAANVSGLYSQENSHLPAVSQANPENEPFYNRRAMSQVSAAPTVERAPEPLLQVEIARTKNNIIVPVTRSSEHRQHLREAHLLDPEEDGDEITGVHSSEGHRKSRSAELQHERHISRLPRDYRRVEHIADHK